jgi:hypothetical protein
MLAHRSSKTSKLGDVVVDVFVCNDGTEAVSATTIDTMIGTKHDLQVVIVLTKHGYSMSCYDLNDVAKLLAQKSKVVTNVQSSKIDNDDDDLYDYTMFGCPF